jgi:glutathione S-transferase
LLALDALRRSPELPLELNELQQLHETALHLGMVELSLVDLEQGDVAGLRRAAEEAREASRRLAAHTGEPPPETAQQRLVDATILIADGVRDAALARLEGIESRPGFAPELQRHVDRVRRRAATMTME